jgi:TPR repeat protein
MNTAPDDFDARLRQLQPAAEAGDLDAMARLGGLYATRQDWTAAEPWARRAAEGGSMMGMQILAGVLASQGDEAQAEEWMGRAQEIGNNTPSGRAVAHMIARITERFGEDPDLEQIRGDAEAGVEDAMTMLGFMLSQTDPEEAVRWLTPRAEAGDSTAMFALGGALTMLEDEEAGTRWLERAGEAGDLVAIHVLSDVFERLGNHEKAEYWARVSADAEATTAAEEAAAGDTGSTNTNSGG